MRVLVAGVGNALRGDDGFGVRAAQRLRADPALPESATVIETGIGGMHLVQELMRGYDALILFDAVDRGGAPGTVALLEPVLPETATLAAAERRDWFCDTHYAAPLRALTLARELGVLPPVVRIIACQPEDAEGYGTEMSAAVAAALDQSVALALETVAVLAD